MTELLHRELTEKIIGVYYDVYNGIMLFPVTVRDKRQIEPENLRRWMASQGVPLGIMANFHAGRLELMFMKETV